MEPEPPIRPPTGWPTKPPTVRELIFKRLHAYSTLQPTGSNTGGSSQLSEPTDPASRFRLADPD
ncbi:hypothetical protein PSS2_gp005 [Cyanophage PSS2]|uniref:hypothetical protein n=1 Tax=Cyanophage PSS2 TaxID=658401 RepID=UPI0001B03FDB|nr:hypothetical protein PSS2_gp005 [Cyanophage PSS2]ACT65567.1 hypothetical protein [Cyanophage PSS2]